MMMRNITFALLISLILVFSCKGKKEDSSNSTDTIKIGVVYPMSGDWAKYGEDARIAADIFLENLNKQKHKFNYEIIFEDNQGSPMRAHAAAQKLILLDKVDVIFSFLSRSSVPVSVLAEKNKVVGIFVVSDPSICDKNYGFCINIHPKDSAGKLHQTLLEKGAKKVSVISVQTQGHLEMTRQFENIANDNNKINIIGKFVINPGEKDFRITIPKMLRHNPDYIIVFMDNPEIDIFIKQLKEQNSSIPVTGIYLINKVEDKSLIEGLWSVEAQIDTEFHEQYKSKTNLLSANYGEYVYTMLEVIVHAYENVGERNNEKVVEFIKGIKDLYTAQGPVSTSESNFISISPVLQKIKNGQIIVIDESKSE